MAEQVNANADAMKQHMLRAITSGDRVSSAHYEMAFDGYPDFTPRIESTQLPAMGRELIEARGHMGVPLQLDGNLKSAGEMNVTITETLSGDALAFAIDAIKNRTRFDISIRLTPEGANGQPIAGVRLLNCWIETDAVDLAQESVTEWVKVPLIIHYNWIDQE